MANGLQNLMRNHINVVGYLNAVAQLLSEFSQAEGPTEIKAEIHTEICREAAQMAEVLEAAARMLGHPGILTLVLSRASQAVTEPSRPDDEPEIQLTTRKVAQA